MRSGFGTRVFRANVWIQSSGPSRLSSPKRSVESTWLNCNGCSGAASTCFLLNGQIIRSSLASRGRSGDGTAAAAGASTGHSGGASPYGVPMGDTIDTLFRPEDLREGLIRDQRGLPTAARSASTSVDRLVL